MPVLSMSTLTELGVMDVKMRACNLLLAHRVDAKSNTPRAQSVLNRLHLAMPRARDNKVTLDTSLFVALPLLHLCMSVVRSDVIREIPQSVFCFNFSLNECWSHFLSLSLSLTSCPLLTFHSTNLSFCISVFLCLCLCRSHFLQVTPSTLAHCQFLTQPIFSLSSLYIRDIAL